MASDLTRKAKRYGFLRAACRVCAQTMIVARSGKVCLNCGEVNDAD